MPMANAALDALDLWVAKLPPSMMEPHYKHILPYLDDYLKTATGRQEYCVVLYIKKVNKLLQKNICQAEKNPTNQYEYMMLQCDT